MANPTYRRIVRQRPLISEPSLPFGGGLIVSVVVTGSPTDAAQGRIVVISEVSA